MARLQLNRLQLLFFNIAGRSPWCLPIALSFGLALISAVGGAATYWTLQRPSDWRLRWTMEDEFTEDHSIHQAQLSDGAVFGPGRIGGGVHLPGGKSLVVLDGWKASKRWTIELWVQALQPATNVQLIAGSGRESESYGLGLWHGAFAAMHYDLQGKRAWLASQVKPSTNRWYHVAATCDGSQVTLFINGTKCTSAAEGIGPTEETSAPMHLGAGHVWIGDTLARTDVFAGNLDHLSVYPRALSEQEVRALWRSTKGNPHLRQWVGDLLCSLALAWLLVAAFAATTPRHAARGASDMAALSSILGGHRTVVAVLLVGISATGILYLATSRECHARDYRRFHDLIANFLEEFDTRTEAYVQHLTALRSWLNNENELTPAKWALMMESMRFSEDFPGLFSVAFAPAVRWKNLAGFESWALKNIQTNYQVHWISGKSERVPLSTAPCSNCPIALPITLYTHVYRAGDFNRRQITDLGRDLLDPSEPPFPESNPTIYPMVLPIRKSQGAGAAQLEELYPSQSDGGESFRGTRIFLGVFTTRTNVSRLGQATFQSLTHEQKLLGVLVSSIAWQQFFDSMLRGRKNEIGFELYRSGIKEGGPRFVAAQSWPPLPRPQEAALRASYQSRFYGRRLRFEFAALPSFYEHSERQWPRLIGLVGLSLSIGVAGLIFIQTRARVIETLSAEQLRASHQQLQHLLQDRERISRDLHDGTIQSIYAIGLGLKRAQKLIDHSPSIAHSQLSETIGELDLAIADLRQFILSLEPNLPNGQSLTSALQALVNRCRRITPSRLDLTVEDDIDSGVSPYLAVHVMNLVREGLSNSIRHAAAQVIRISLRRKAAALQLQVSDDGKGFAMDQSPGSGSGHGNMRARVQEIGGTLTIHTLPGSGTTITATLPMAPASKITPEIIPPS